MAKAQSDYFLPIAVLPQTVSTDNALDLHSFTHRPHLTQSSLLHLSSTVGSNPMGQALVHRPHCVHHFQSCLRLSTEKGFRSEKIAPSGQKYLHHARP